jgi:hypothetical protein
VSTGFAMGERSWYPRFMGSHWALGAMERSCLYWVRYPVFWEPSPWPDDCTDVAIGTCAHVRAPILESGIKEIPEGRLLRP